MAIYHFSAQMIKRSDGRSATAAAAYRAAEKIVDRTTAEVFDYTRKSGVYESTILAPELVPIWATNREELWNRVEEVERRNDAQVAREIDVAIPRELDNHGRVELVREFVQEQFVELGMIADVCFHDFESGNPHCHIMLTTRDISSEGFGKKRRDWNEHSLMPKWREEWSKHANRALEREGFIGRIDHRSYEDQGVGLVATQHLGPAIAGMERDGIKTRIGDKNREIAKMNAIHRDQEAAIEFERLEVMAEIERIHTEALFAPDPEPKPSKCGKIEIAHSRRDIAARARKEDGRLSQGIAGFIANQYKARLFFKTWNSEIAPTILKKLKWVDTENRSVTLRSGEQIIDKGDSVSISKGSDDGIRAAILMAQSKGWDVVHVEGSYEFQLRAAMALKEVGIEPVLTSEIAKKRFGEIMERHQKKLPHTVDEQTMAKAPGLETNPHPISGHENAAKPMVENKKSLRSLVRRAADKAPLAMTNTFRDDRRKLRRWAHELWSELISQSESDGLSELVVEIIEEKALIAGYSVNEIKAIVIEGGWIKEKSYPTEEQADTAPLASATNCLPRQDHECPGT